MDDLFYKELTSVSWDKETCIILQVIITISHGQTSLERELSLNKNLLANNMEEVTIQSCHLMKDNFLLSNLSCNIILWTNLTKCCSMLKYSTEVWEPLSRNQIQRAVTCKLSAETYCRMGDKWTLKGKYRMLRKLLKDWKVIFFAFVEKAEKRNFHYYLWQMSVRARLRK